MKNFAKKNEPANIKLFSYEDDFQSVLITGVNKLNNHILL